MERQVHHHGARRRLVLARVRRLGVAHARCPWRLSLSAEQCPCRPCGACPFPLSALWRGRLPGADGDAAGSLAGRLCRTPSRGRGARIVCRLRRGGPMTLCRAQVPGFGWRQFTARFWCACGLALLLLFVQHLAQTHALKHLAADSLVAAASDDASDCPQCLVLGGLHGSATATTGGKLPPAASDGPLAFMPVAESPRRPTTAHTIRAPPENRD